MRLGYKLLGAISLAALMLTACNLETSHTEDTIKSEIIEEDGQVITVVTPKPVIDQTEPALVNTEEGKKYQIQTRLTDFQLLSPTTGLAWGCTRNELRLYITHDNGVTWTNISPSATVQFPLNPRYGKDIYFMDPLNGWIVRHSSDSIDTIVLRTTDGGMTWKVASFPGNHQVEAMAFSDYLNGWILTVDHKDSGMEQKKLYTTNNGGATWGEIKVTSKPLNNPSDPAAVTKHILRPSLVFANELNGLMTGMKSDGPTLYQSLDGGEEWTENVRFPKYQTSQACERYVAGEIKFFSGNKQSGWLPVGCSNDNTTKYDGYFTEDSGKTWELVHFNLPRQTGLNEKMTPTFLNQKEGWSIQGSLVYHTLNQGASWTALPQNDKLQEIMADYPEVVKIHFFSSQVGWMLVGQSDQMRSLLLQTQDGGVSWQVL